MTLTFDIQKGSYTYTREPLYTKFAEVAGWLQSTSAEIGQFLLWEVFFPDYCHLYTWQKNLGLFLFLS